METTNQQQTDHEPNSAAYLGEYRDFWWHKDFMDLMAKRWKLDQCHTVLDLGCGLGHWGRKILPYIAPEGKIYGIDMEQEWVDGATKNAERYPGRFEYKRSVGETIPFADNTFDLVTCQAVLLHVDLAKVVMKEMIRVLKPGGQLIVIEPNGLCSEVIYDTVGVTEDVSDIVRTFEFHVLCEAGQRKLGQGFGSVGDLMPIYFQECGLKDIKVYTSDKTETLIPPYDTEEQQSYIRTLKEWYDTDLMVWPKEQSRKYYLAGGGDPSKFDSYWDLLRTRFARRLKAIEENTYSIAGGSMLYLVSGTK